jgi:hypothetical protein
MSRLYGVGLPIEVDTDAHGVPVSFRLNNQVYPVTQVADRWRIDEDWWDQRTWREYFKILGAGSVIFILYRELTTKQWFLQRYYD